MKLFVTSIFILFTTLLKAQNTFSYAIDLVNIKNDKVTIIGQIPKVEQDTIAYNFCKVVPGTYAVEDYGRFVEDFKAFDINGKELFIKKINVNKYLINDAKKLASVAYKVNDGFDAKMKNKIFEPASTNFEEGKNFVINNGGLFGYLTGKESLPIELSFKKPNNFFGATSLQNRAADAGYQNFKANNFHQLIDCPLLFAVPDTAMFYVNNTLVTIACYDVTGRPRAKYFYNELKRDMQAIANFLPKLPVDNYTFLIYIDNLSKDGAYLNGTKKFGLFSFIRTIKKFLKLGIGALEHGNSSMYYLANFGDDPTVSEFSLKNQLAGAATHEFLHIITPLGLHSQHIENFNFANPTMCQHLWLYEGVTEYNAHLIKLQNGIYTKQEFLSVMQSKNASAKKFPIKKMSFAEMSAYVLENPYKKEYIHVYDRGAILAWLLDVKIIELTNGNKNLKNILLDLTTKYKGKYFEEESLYDEITSMVNPKLKTFFDSYIRDTVDYNLTLDLKAIGIAQEKSISQKMPANPLNKKDNDIKVKQNLLQTFIKVKKTGTKEWAGLKKGDVLSTNMFQEYFFKNYESLKEDATIPVQVYRKKQWITIPIKVKMIDKKLDNQLLFKDKLNEAEAKYLKVFLGER